MVNDWLFLQEFMDLDRRFSDSRLAVGRGKVTSSRLPTELEIKLFPKTLALRRPGRSTAVQVMTPQHLMLGRLFYCLRSTPEAHVLSGQA